MVGGSPIGILRGSKEKLVGRSLFLVKKHFRKCVKFVNFCIKELLELISLIMHDSDPILFS